MTEALTIQGFYSAGSKSGKVLGLVCDEGHVTVPPRHSCRVCSSTILKVVELSGRGKIISFTQVYAKSKDFPLKTPYCLALTQLDEGGNLLGVLDENVPKELGESVKVSFKEIRGDLSQPTIFFESV